MFKRLKRWFAGSEIGVLGAEIDQIGEQILQLEIKHDALTKRFDRVQARYGMRELREQRAAHLQPQPGRASREHMSDDEILDEIQALDAARRGH